MKSSTTRILFLGAATALGACQHEAVRPVAAPPVQAPSTAAASPLDESALQAPIRFRQTDLDPTKAACSDLAGQVNGFWLAKNPIPGDRTTWGTFEALVERSNGIQRQLAEAAARDPGSDTAKKLVGDLWATGMDEARINELGIKPLADHLAAIDALKDKATIVAYLRDAFARGDGVLFGFGPEADFKSSDTNIAYVSQGGLGLPDRGYYFDADKKAKLDAYRAHVTRILELSGLPAADAAKQAGDVIAFETRLAKVSKSNQELARDTSLFYNPVTPTEADKLTPNFAWTRFFDSQGVPAQEKFSLAMPAFHQEVSKMLADTPAARWKSYLRYHLVDNAAPYLSEPFVQAHFEFHNRALRGQKELQPRWKRVLQTIDDQAGYAMGELYVRVAFPPESKARMEQLVKNLSAALKTHIEALTWMSPETKTKALAKWATFSPQIGYPEKWRDYSGLTTGRESYIANVFAGTEFNYRRELAKIGKPVDRTDWGGLLPQTVNASYNPLRNEIKFPAAILQPPFFDPSADDALNYGGIGAVIGHEMSHGYDDQGSRFGPSGNFENWWTNADAKAFAALTDKLIQQFDAYEVAPGQHANGKLTLGENIADLGGLAIAYDALKSATAGQPDPKVEGLTRDQRFFYAWATVWRRAHTDEEIAVRAVTDPHALAPLRAIGAPSNFPPFAAAFGCKPGDPMVRSGDKLIKIW